MEGFQNKILYQFSSLFRPKNGNFRFKFQFDPDKDA